MIVVTGATGNVGRPLVAALLTAGEEVTAVARRIVAQDVPAGVAFQQAEVAAVALRDARHVGNTYTTCTLTGPAPVSPRQQAAAIEAALGEPVRFVEQSREEARARMLRFMPEPVVESTPDILGLPSAQERQVSPDVEQVLGRPARTFAQWAARNIVAFK
jgi:uncharacterized protein YbjT (DUF2867 family)